VSQAIGFGVDEIPANSANPSLVEAVRKFHSVEPEAGLCVISERIRNEQKRSGANFSTASDHLLK
jgi:hypothetical protein